MTTPHTAFFSRIHHFAIIPVIEIESVEQALPLADTFINAGLPLLEITLRTPAGLQSIQAIARAYPQILLGAGTILDRAQAEQAAAAGAQFLVSPGLPEDALRWAQQNQLPFLPGAVTPNEILQGIRLDCQYFKFFPAGVMGGLAAIRAVSDPYPGVRFVPTGGINSDNLAEYLRDERILAVGGSWLAKRQAIAKGQYERIRSEIAQALQAVRAVRNGSV
ncbi:MAG: bifunctional 4-hydroxy-2-oxoglutarate aldolase/2-dehydro-3-deoxy-phosphogluconate aldolase [Chloroflexota bacterium]